MAKKFSELRVEIASGPARRARVDRYKEEIDRALDVYGDITAEEIEAYHFHISYGGRGDKQEAALVELEQKFAAILPGVLDVLEAKVEELDDLRAEVEERRVRAESRWTYPPITDLDRANEEVRRLGAYISEYCSARDYANRLDPEVVAQRLAMHQKWSGEAIMEVYYSRRTIERLVGHIDALKGFLVDLFPETGLKLGWYAIERDRQQQQIKAQKKELQAQFAANAKHKQEIRELREWVDRLASVSMDRSEAEQAQLDAHRELAELVMPYYDAVTGYVDVLADHAVPAAAVASESAWQRLWNAGLNLLSAYTQVQETKTDG